MRIYSEISTYLWKVDLEALNNRQGLYMRAVDHFSFLTLGYGNFNMFYGLAK